RPLGALVAVASLTLAACVDDNPRNSASTATDTATDNATSPDMSFFITSVGLGDGANLGGLSGADAHCNALASAVGAGDKEWRAYLSASAADGQAAVNARDRIGSGPWQNARGVVVANSVDHLHSADNSLSKENSLSEL